MTHLAARARLRLAVEVQLRPRVVEDRGLWWEDVDDFDIRDRIHELTLPEPAGRAELEKFIKGDPEA